MASKCKRVIILFEGRSGSSHLVELLDQHPRCRFLPEDLAELKEEGWESQRLWLDKTLGYRDESEIASLSVIGFKTKLRDIVDPEAFLAYLNHHPEIAIIRMFRRNAIKQTLSAIRAWKLANETGEYNIKQGNKHLKLPVEDIRLERFEALREWVESFEETLDVFMPRINAEKYLIAYEDLLHRKEVTLEKFYAWLGLDFIPSEDVHVKHTSDDLREAIPNFEELRAQYRGTAYYSMFEGE